jgi:phage baseplate assembly protein V
MSEALMRAISKAVAPLTQRVKNMIARGVITAIQDSEGLQLIQGTLLADEVSDGMERFQNYGFSSVPPPGSEFIVLFVAGRSHPVVIAVDNRAARPKDKEIGDSIMYSIGGNSILLSAEDGKIHITAPDNIIIRSEKTLRLDGKQIEIHADESIKWDCGGRGFDYTPALTNSFETGSGTGTTNPIDPPEHGGPPAS